MHGRVVWVVVCGFLLGVAARSLGDFTLAHAALTLLIAGAVLLYARTARDSRTAALLVPLALAALAAGMWRMDAVVRAADPALAAAMGESVTLRGTVSAEPDVRERSVRVTIRVRELLAGSSSVPVDGQVLAVAPAYTPVSYGERVRVSGTLELPEEFETGEGRHFDYPLFLAKDGTLFLLSRASLESEGGRKGSPLVAAAIAVKHAFLAGLRRALPEPQAGLGGGITVGDKRSVGEELSEVFQSVSLQHVLVFSGFNLSVVISFVRAVCARAPRRLLYAVIGCSVVFAVLIAGGAASAVRAGAMALIAALAGATGRQFLALRALAAVSFVMVAWNPYILLFDPGFQLSVLATAGLILIAPLIERRLSRLTGRFGLREIVAATIGAQIAVLPLLLYTSGSLSLAAFPANILALAPVPAAMFLSIGAGIGGLVLGPLAPIAALPAQLLLSYIVLVAQFFSAMPLSSVAIPAFSAWWLLVAYGAIGAVLARAWAAEKRRDAQA